jgi:hypothetical protein
MLLGNVGIHSIHNKGYSGRSTYLRIYALPTAWPTFQLNIVKTIITLKFIPTQMRLKIPFPKIKRIYYF